MSGNAIVVITIVLVILFTLFVQLKKKKKRLPKQNIRIDKSSNPYDTSPPYFHIYAKKHREWLSNLRNNSKSRTLLFTQHPSGGMGNKLRALVGSTFLAMMTDRAILLYNWKTFSSYYTTPLSTLDPPTTIVGGRRFADYITCFNEDKYKEMATAEDDHLKIMTYCDLGEQYIKYGNYGNKLKEYGLVTDRSHNIIEKQGIEYRYFLFRYFFKPSNIVVGEMAKLKNIFSKDKLLIGFHFRTNHQGWNDRGVTFLNAEQIENGIKDAVKLSKKLKKVEWYISTDDNNILKKYKKEYPQYVINDVHEKAHSRGSGSIVTEQYVFSVAENFILSKSDILFLTQQSSYSGMAYSRSKLSILEFLDKKEISCKLCNVTWIYSQ